MNLWQRLVQALKNPVHRPAHQTAVELKQQAEIVRAEAEEMVQMVNREEESGIWPQDMIRGTYRVNRRTVRREQR